MSTARALVLAARPKTLGAGAAPVLLGTALAIYDGGLHLAAALAALAGAILIQVGTNYANDVLDFRRGADAVDRLGPPRAVQSGWVRAETMVRAAVAAFAAAAVVGLYLVARGGWPVLLIGASGICFGILYTAGPRPLAYIGAADIFVLAYFGVLAVAGTYYVQALTVTSDAVLAGAAMGCWAAAILTVNNLRDIHTDEAAGKRTLAVRLGRPRTVAYYAGLMAAAVGLPLAPALGGVWPVLTLVAVAVVVPAYRLVTFVRDTEGKPLNRALGGTARLQALHALLLAGALIVAARG